MSTPVPPAELVRMPAGTIETYYINPGREQSFLKKVSVYANRVGAKHHHDTWVCVRMSDHSVRMMIVVKIIKAGRPMKKRGRKSSKQGRK